MAQDKRRPVPRAGDPIEKYLKDLHASEGWHYPEDEQDIDQWENEGGHAANEGD